mmetsp:Transcript_10118/g.14191  ORF Transcript_10118/g.14191 Transcript_10118/m.14191 type:complete len:109 (-) Transcript_10118:348-674(-)
MTSTPILSDKSELWFAVHLQWCHPTVANIHTVICATTNSTMTTPPIIDLVPNGKSNPIWNMKGGKYYRFDPVTCVKSTEQIDSYDVRRSRCGFAQALEIVLIVVHCTF